MTKWTMTHEKFLDDQEVKQFQETTEKAMLYAKRKGRQLAVRDYTILELALGSGLRVSEIANLKLDDLNLRKGQNSLIVRHGKGDKLRQVKFSSRLKDIIEGWLVYRDKDSPYLFYSERQEKMTTSAIQRVFKKYAKKAGLSERYSIHSLRHTYATMLYRSSNYNLRMIQKQLGHSSPSISAVYAAVVDEDLEEAVEKL
jgi:integrase